MLPIRYQEQSSGYFFCNVTNIMYFEFLTKQIWPHVHRLLLFYDSCIQVIFEHIVYLCRLSKDVEASNRSQN